MDKKSSEQGSSESKSRTPEQIPIDKIWIDFSSYNLENVKATKKRQCIREEDCESSSGLAKKQKPAPQPIQFHLVPYPAEEQALLPKLEDPFLTVPDKKQRASYIKKHLAKELNLQDHSKVELFCEETLVTSNKTVAQIKKIWSENVDAIQLLLPEDDTGVLKRDVIVLGYKKARE